MLVAISGSQGSGKSSILKEINKLGYPTVERKTSRSILDDWNITLQQVNNDHELTIDFQEEITKRKCLDEQEAINSDELWFGERTHTDLFIYSLVSLGKDNRHSLWMDEYYKRCMKYNQDYKLVWYLKAGMFNVVHDGVRGSNYHYSRMIDTTMLDFTQQMVHSSKLSIIDTPDLEQRVNIITLQSAAILK